MICISVILLQLVFSITCEVHGERFNDAWLQDMICSGGNSSEPPTSACRDGPSERPKQSMDVLVHYFSTE